MTRDLKEKTIPITFDDFICYLLIFVVGISILGLALLLTIPTSDDVFSIGGALCLVGLMLGGIFGGIVWTDRWDLNPVHAIGYCLRWKRRNT